jgi:ubiquinol-cytochrome c reductase cytochrome b subunit
MLVFFLMFAWPSLERRVTKDYGFHNLLDRPRDAPWRTALGAAILTWIFLIFATGSADRVYVLFGISYRGQIWAMRFLVWVIPAVVGVITKRVCDELRAGERVEARRHAAEAEATA